MKRLVKLLAFVFAVAALSASCTNKQKCAAYSDVDVEQAETGE